VSTTSDRPRTFAVWTLFVLLIVQAVGAIGGGIALVAGPNGEITHMPLSDLEGSPFDSFLIPGIILLFGLGLLPLAAAIGVWRQRTWAWWAAGVVGCGLVIWIAVQTTIIDFSWLQVAYLVMGLLIIAACLPRSVRRWCGVSA